MDVHVYNDGIHSSTAFRYSILPAFSLEGILEVKMVTGSFDGTLLKCFLSLLDEMKPYPEPHSVLVMDNCAIHHVDSVQDMCDK